jgi:hypothetical protein
MSNEFSRFKFKSATPVDGAYVMGGKPGNVDVVFAGDEALIEREYAANLEALGAGHVVGDAEAAVDKPKRGRPQKADAPTGAQSGPAVQDAGGDEAGDSEGDGTESGTDAGQDNGGGPPAPPAAV